MAAIPDRPSIEEITEDLELYQALLQSLIETRPTAVEEKQELQETVTDLEMKLAQHQGVPYHAPSSQPAQSPRGALQYDGAAESSSARPRANENNVFTPAQHHTSSPPHRKRPVRLTDFSSPPGLVSTKRVRSEQLQQPHSSPSSAGSSQTRSSHNGSGDRGPLADLFGLNDEGLEDFEAEQYEAEKWLQERRAQERRDEEFARRLQERLNEELSYVPQKQVQQPQKSHIPHIEPGKPFTITEKITKTMNFRPITGAQSPNYGYSSGQQPFNAPGLGTSSKSHQHPSYAPSPFATYPSNQAYIQQGPSSSDSEGQEGSDNDLAEISAKSFYQNHPSITPPGPSHNRFPLPSEYSPAMYIPSGFPFRPPGFAPKFPSEIVSRGNPPSGSPYGSIYPMTDIDIPGFPSLRAEKYPGIGSAAALYEYVNGTLNLSPRDIMLTFFF